MEIGNAKKKLLYLPQLMAIIFYSIGKEVRKDEIN
jgi:hypothetical protein